VQALDESFVGEEELKDDLLAKRAEGSASRLGEKLCYSAAYGTSDNQHGMTRSVVLRANLRCVAAA
jgi:hypothetical protein